ncbi:prephenate dehydratase [Boudabousia marimammalium]|uniref:Prephenate dehydratase n=1 Tax=Boudabousia marimammalium TaxID=156892 RepID=A0A1Q5PJ54_9ACTO|nr:prephenate dehydratase [Boudabousia marimammalium]OKL45880.1 prephenate dehydratase [Boudabousia marimammalium]
MKQTQLVAIQGEAGSNSAMAVQQILPNAQIFPCDSFDAAFDAVKNGSADLALIPVENSSAGRVADPHSLLPDSNLHIIGEHFLPIRFDLVANPGATLGTIKTVRSHVHAFGQCRKLLEQYDWKRHTSADTAGAAREVAFLKDPSIAALAPAGIAPLYGLEVLAAGVEDTSTNATRFLLLSPQPQITKERPAITTVLFRARNVPAALYKCLGGFATNSVNITKLESYQLGGTFQASQFYIDIDGHVEDHNVQLALEELSFFVSYLKVMGCYPAHPFRAETLSASGERTFPAPSEPDKL